MGWAQGLFSVKFYLISLISKFAELFSSLADQMSFIQQNAWAPNTIQALSSEWKVFKIFCALASIQFLPIAPWALCFFATWLISTGRVKTRGSLAQYISAVRTIHRTLLCEDCVPTPSQYGPLDLILKGVRRLAMHRTKKSLPVSPPILKNLLLSTIPSHFATSLHQTLLVYKSLSLLYFLTMLRSSNLIAKSLKKIDLKMILCWENISPLNNDITQGILITVPKSKNNQFGERDHLVPLAAAENELLCPVKAVQNLIKLYGKENCRGSTPVFKIPDGNGNFTVVQRHKYDWWFKLRLQNMGVNPKLFTLHGFRHAGIQECLLAEGNLALCKLTSDHSSDAILEYAFIPPNRRLAISTKVNKSLAAAIAMSPGTARPQVDRI